MRLLLRIGVIVLTVSLLACNSSQLLEDNSERKVIAADYKARVEEFTGVRGDLFNMTDTIGDKALKEAVRFLLAYMPLSDLALYEPEYLFDNCLISLRAREEMAWGLTVPPATFFNFVLPLRVNNENPDDFRTVCYDELKERLQGLDMMDAALEVNRWCNEKVAYQAADSRTSSPQATILSARGRCGEESVFTVSALRAVSIPARQVYTPRWAHTDDNHAWVEFWVDGSWHYLGACEPEPVPDLGWFTEPARRAMMVHTKAFGRYSGGEELIGEERLYSEINTLVRYANTKRLRVRVTDRDGEAVPGARTDYLLYNYAEFYPLATMQCDNRGESRLTTGYGSLLIWADDGTSWGFVHAWPEDTLVTVRLSSDLPEETITFDLMAPEVPEPLTGLSPELTELNNLVLIRGDSIRNLYVSSWMAGVDAGRVAAAAGLPAEAVSRVLQRSMGNYRSVVDFITYAGSRSGLALRILENISEKDLRDTPTAVLADHLDNAPAPAPGSDTTLYDRYVLSPRVSDEILSPFRSAFAAVPAELTESFRNNPALAIKWIENTITIKESDNHYKTPLIPAGVLRLKSSDRHSRDIFFVALCRYSGIPARLAPGTGKPQYHNSGRWHDVWFSDEVKPTGAPGYVRFTAAAKGTEPEYHIHFSLARIESGRLTTLDWGYGVRLRDLPDTLSLDPGNYMLTTGNRDADGNIMASVSFVRLTPGEMITLDVTPRQLPAGLPSGGRINLDTFITPHTGADLLLSSLAGKGVVMAWLEPGREPTRHLLNDLPALKQEYEDWGGWFIFFTDPQRGQADFSPESVEGIPEKTIFAIDDRFRLMASLPGVTGRERALPVVIYCNSRGDILFSSEGYRIGTGQQLLARIQE